VGQGWSARSVPGGRPARSGPGRAGVARASLRPRRLRRRAPALDGPTGDPSRPGGRPRSTSPHAARSADPGRAPSHAACQAEAVEHEEETAAAEVRRAQGAMRRSLRQRLREGKARRQEVEAEAALQARAGQEEGGGRHGDPATSDPESRSAGSLTGASPGRTGERTGDRHRPLGHRREAWDGADEDRPREEVVLVRPTLGLSSGRERHRCRAAAGVPQPLH
jgi:hypothetical protein